MKRIFETSEPLSIAEGEIDKKTHRHSSFDIEDGGAAIIVHAQEVEQTTENAGMFVRIQSWDEEAMHDDLRKFNGKRLRVTVEAIED
jgi:hypothetical protein